MNIEYYKKNVYGVEYMYIKDDKKMKIVKGLTGRKTLTYNDLHYLSLLGCTHELIHECTHIHSFGESCNA
jgi:hypothetical protein